MGKCVELDHFVEDIVIKRDRLLLDALYLACWLFIVMTSMIAVLGLQAALMGFGLVSLLVALLCAGLSAAAYVAKDWLKVEYDYTFTNGVLEFARVMRSSRRKELGSVHVAHAAACGHVAHEAFRRYVSMRDVEKKNWFLNRDGNLFYMYWIKEGKKYLIVLEPSGEMVEMIRRYLPDGVYQG